MLFISYERGSERFYRFREPDGQFAYYACENNQVPITITLTWGQWMLIAGWLDALYQDGAFSYEHPEVPSYYDKEDLASQDRDSVDGSLGKIVSGLAACWVPF